LFAKDLKQTKLVQVSKKDQGVSNTYTRSLFGRLNLTRWWWNTIYIFCTHSSWPGIFGKRKTRNYQFVASCCQR